jgi:DNA-binding NtrC family response regulator
MILQPIDLGLGMPTTNESQTLQQLDLSGTLSDVAHRALRLVESKKIQEVLIANDRNKSKTAEDLGISYKTLLTKLRDYDL